MNLYVLTDNYVRLLDMLTDEDMDKQLILDTLESVDGEFEIKAENYAKIIRNLESEISSIKEEEARLAARRRSRENNIQLLKNNLEASMKKTGKTKFKTTLFNFSIAKNGGKQKIEIFGDLPKEYAKTIIEPDNEKIRKALESGNTLEFAKLLDRGESLRIK